MEAAALLATLQTLPQELAAMKADIATFKEKSEIYDLVLDKYVSQEVAAELCGLSVPTLIKERRKKVTLIKCRMVGKAGTTPEYLFSSCIAYRKSKHDPVLRQMYLDQKAA